MNSNEVHFDGKIAQKAIIVRDGAILLMRDPREKDKIWELPGGRLNVEEDPRVGLAREIFEELGVHINVHEVVHMEQFFQHSEGRNAFVIIYKATLIDSEAELHLDDREVSEVRFVPFAEVTDYKLFPEYERTLRHHFANLPK
ncbi:hypothetical protein A2592_01125 [Candidatus Kaiserbacteria bacterium RIFOXYD1_FULL_42_15]|uniref:Nudix hydrolase domain-containing protein n=1 Tax=Candidatus Kaiserbacteria bacterium RIFOXYD1_FULL_42_15 TaxID=1798532 RepID=A0A1F6FT45_9BACT|nr:MAG: hypothetical protein A2592_01125 [Candidatus Kaiserbacteria bacterium RIFOXYD1_FULL_42_15]